MFIDINTYVGHWPFRNLKYNTLSSLSYLAVLKGRKTLFTHLLYMLPLAFLTALINAAFNHEGATILVYLPGENPLTLESVVCSMCAAAMILSVVCWFSCYNEVMTSDKFIYLFGRVSPALSLIFSMTLRFVPRLGTLKCDFIGIFFVISYFLLCIAPVVIELKGARRWKKSE